MVLSFVSKADELISPARNMRGGFGYHEAQYSEMPCTIRTRQLPKKRTGAR